jgi:hypothetical protein
MAIMPRTWSGSRLRMSRPPIRIVLAQQQPQDGGFAGAAGADDANRLTGGNLERQATMGVAAPRGVRERDGIEGDVRPQPRHPGSAGGRRVAGGIEQRIHPPRRRLPDHALVQHTAQVPQRPEYFGTRHQYNEQCLHRHGAMLNPPGAHRQRRRRPQRRAEVGEEPGQQPQRQDPERAVGQAAGAPGQPLGKGGALAERLQRGQPLQGIEELLAERLERRRPGDRGPLVGVVHHHRQRQRGGCRCQQHGRGRHVPPGQHGEDHHGGAGGNGQLRQIGAEECLQLLHPVDHRQHDPAGALRPEPGRAKLGDPIEQPCPQHRLHPPGGRLRQHGAAVVQPRPQPHANRRFDRGQGNLPRRRAGERQRQHPRQADEPQDAECHRHQPEPRRGRDPPPQPRRQRP